MLLARLGLVATLTLSAFGLSTHPTEGTKEVTTTAVSIAPQAVAHKVHMMSLSEMHPLLVEQLRTHRAGSVKFWEAVSWCETNHKWNDSGYYSGGLGMAHSVWLNYGGKEFSSRPSKATKEEQIIVANRVAFLGFQTRHTYATLEDQQNNKPYFRPAVGWRSMKNWGKNCVNWRTRKPARDRYTEEGMKAWKKSRQS